MAIFFDIESGGKTTESSIISVGYGTSPSSIQRLVAKPEGKLFRWSERQIWQPLKGLGDIGTEKALLGSFLSHLEASPGEALMGWNIGTSPSKNSRGFDVPFILGRASKHGLEERYRQTLLGRPIVDIGAEMSLKMAQAVTRYGPKLVQEGVLHPELLESAQGFMKKAHLVHEMEGVPWSEMGQELHRQGVKVSGWQLGTIHEALGLGKIEAHEASRDVAATMGIAKYLHTELTEGFVRNWAPLALENKLISSARSAPWDKALATPQRYKDILEVAAHMQTKRPDIYPSLSSRIQKEIKNLAELSGGRIRDIEAGRGLTEAWREIGEPIAARSLGKLAMGRFATMAGIGLGLGALTLLKPGHLFSGKDDNYNTINGLPHGGEAEKGRRRFTSFGSGWLGLGHEPSKKEKIETQKRFQFFKEALKKYGVEAGTGHKRIIIPKDILSQKQLTDVLGFVPVSIAIPEAGQTQQVSYRHPAMNYHIHAHGDVWTMHEDEYAASTMLVKKWYMERAYNKANTSIFTLVKEFIKGIPHVITEGIPGLYYYLEGKLTGGEGMRQRLGKDLPRQYWNQIARIEAQVHRTHRGIRGLINRISGKDDDYNTIEGLQHGGEAEKSRKKHTDFGSGWQGLWKSIINKPGQIRRSFQVANLLNKESNRAIANITREIFHGAKAGKVLELGVAGITAAEMTHFGMEVIGGGLTGGLMAAAGASFMGTKYLYEIIKKRDVIKNALILASEKPIETKLAIQASGTFLSKEVASYIKTGERNVLSTYIRAGGGEYGREAVLAHLESNHLGVDLKYLNGIANTFSARDDVWNVIEGLQHTGMAKQLRSVMTDFGSGWIRSALTRAAFSLGIKKQGIARPLIKVVAKGIYARRIPSGIGGFAISAERLGLLSTGEIKEQLGRQVVKEFIPSASAAAKSLEISAGELRGISRQDLLLKLHQFRNAGAPLREIEGKALMAPMNRTGTNAGRPRAMIQGMQEGGIAAKLRKKDTDFGSPVDLLKATSRAGSWLKKEVNSLLGRQMTKRTWSLTTSAGEGLFKQVGMEVGETLEHFGTHKQFYGKLAHEGSISRVKYKDIMKGFKEQRGAKFEPVPFERIRASFGSEAPATGEAWEVAKEWAKTENASLLKTTPDYNPWGMKAFSHLDPDSTGAVTLSPIKTGQISVGGGTGSVNFAPEVAKKAQAIAEGMRNQNRVGFLRRWFSSHKEGQQRAAINAYKPGRRHLHHTNSSIKW